MLGNAFEWCDDDYLYDELKHTTVLTDPRGRHHYRTDFDYSSNTRWGVLFGGSFLTIPEEIQCRKMFENGEYPSVERIDFGFRCVQ